MEQKNKNLGIFGAVLGAFLGRPLSHYPRRDNKLIATDTLLAEINAELRTASVAANSEDLKHARESLDEVKELTEYQDQKSARLLTIIAFLTAAAGTVFAKVLDVYPLHAAWASSGIWARSGLLLVYVLFGLYLLCVAFGALVSFHATQTRFVWPKGKSDEANKTDVTSYLFFQSIIRTQPGTWARSFIRSTTEDSAGDNLSVEYYKNYVAESYLIAAKIGEKVRYLEPAQRLLQWAIRLLILWLLALAVTVAIAPTSHDVETGTQSAATMHGANAPYNMASCLDNNQGGKSQSNSASIPASSTLPASQPTARITAPTSKATPEGLTHGQSSNPIGRRQHAMGHGLGVCGSATQTPRRG